MVDPIFSLIELPDEFKARRAVIRRQLANGGEITLLNAKGPGCVRHFWLTSNGDGRGINIRINVDNAAAPQVDMPLNVFFGILLGLQPFLIDSPAFSVLPNNAYNCYFPIPFNKSCHISFYGREVGGRFNSWHRPWVFGDSPAADVDIFSQCDWQEFKSDKSLSEYRFHADFSSEYPAGEKDVFSMADIHGRGFVAAMTKGITHADRKDLVYHTGGSTWLIDGATDPHAIRGFNEEDDFGFSWGYFKYESKWVGCPHIIGEGPTANEFIAWRIFGVDPVPFKDSLKLYFGSRPDNTEGVLYYYKVPETKTPEIITPPTWKISGPYDAVTFEKFCEDESCYNADEVFKVELESCNGWVDPRTEFRKRFDMWNKYPAAIKNVDPTYVGGDRWPVGVACLMRGEVDIVEDGKYTLRLAFDDWCRVWVNGKFIDTLRHDNGLDVAEIPVNLVKGKNEIKIKLANQDNIEFRLFALNCVIR